MQNNNRIHWLISKTQNDAVWYANIAVELQNNALKHQK